MNGLKGLILALAVLGIFNLAGCGSNQYSDAEAVMNEKAEALKKYVGAMESADNAQDVVDAINGFTSDMKDLIPKMKNMRSKYPEIINPREMPDELKAPSEEIANLSVKLQEAVMKTMQYMQDPGVQKAMEEQGRIMMEMAQE